MLKSKILSKLQEFERAYTKESLLPNSSEWRLAEHPTDVPDLLPTQGKSETASSEGGDSSISHAYNSAPATSLESRGDAMSSERKVRELISLLQVDDDIETGYLQGGEKSYDSGKKLLDER